MKKLGYIRVSTDKQVIDRQVDRLRAVCDQVFMEDAVSAVGKKRPVYDQVTQELQEGDTFVVVALDRAYRSVVDALLELEKLQNRGVHFISLSQSFDTRTPEGKLFYTLSAALAEWERAILSQRTREGMEAARRRGSQIGRPLKLSLEQVHWANDQINSGESLKNISEQLNVSPRTVRRALNSLA